MSRNSGGGAAKPASILSGVNLKKPVHQGYLYKEGHEHLAFNYRYFALYRTFLVYYDDEHNFKRDVSRGTIEHRHKAIILEGLYLSKPEKKPKGAKYCFILHAPDTRNKRHTFLLVTKTREERREWMEKLQSLNPGLLSAPVIKISPDTPRPGRKEGPSHEVVTVDGPESESGPDHSGSSFLDIGKLDVRDGPSDVED